MKMIIPPMLYKCKICKKGFQHLPRSDDGGKNACKVCFKTFTRQDALTRHLKRCKKGVQKEHKCENCKKSFDRKFNLVRHMAVHEKENSLKYRCEVDGCERVFKRNDKFVVHQLSHNITKVHVNMPSKVNKFGLHHHHHHLQFKVIYYSMLAWVRLFITIVFLPFSLSCARLRVTPSSHKSEAITCS